ncbi:MAG: triphosphoribosyl-dephospho-CoA synthase [Thermoprotei archaeon]
MYRSIWKYPYLLGLSIILEASCYPKPGNVHRLADLPNTNYYSFLLCGMYSIHWFKRGVRRGKRGWGKLVFGDLVYGVLREVTKGGGANACLGSLTLLSPLSVSIGYSIRSGDYSLSSFIENVSEVLRSTTVYDAIYFYRAVRLVKPSHIKPGTAPSGYVDVWSHKYVRELLEKGHRLVDILRASSEKEIVHDELIKGYPRSIEALGFLEERLGIHGDFNRGVVETQLYLMSRFTDSLVVRKHGSSIALEIMRRSANILEDVLSSRSEWYKPVLMFDRWLRNKGINPGSIADIVVATIALYLLKHGTEAVNFEFTPLTLHIFG